VGSDRYGWQARVYDRLLEPMNAPLRAVAAGLVAMPPQAVVLDVGCGTGAALAEYRDRGCRVRGADPSPTMLQQARRRLGTQADLRVMQGSRVPFEDGSADLVLLSLVLHALSDRDADSLLAEAARVLAPGGQVLVTDFGVAGLRFPRGWGMRAVTVLAELAAGPAHAHHALQFLRRGGVAALFDPLWTVDPTKHTAGGNITIAVLSRS
jgi:ubiquinone/menaquinone biosynthesis C-methylase UbiE